MDDLFDVTIIGAGPTGLFAAYYAGFRSLRTKIVDSQPDLGGQITALYPDKYIYDVAGFPKILGKDLVRNLVEQAMQYNPEVLLNEQIQTVEDVGDRVLALRSDGRVHYTKVAIITAGIGAFTPKTFKRPELDRYMGKGLYYAVKNKEDFRDKRLLVIGGGDSALDWALGLIPYARQITLIHRRDQFRAHEDSVRKLFDSPITVRLFYELKELRGDDQVREAVIFDNRTKQEEVLEVDAVLAFLGLISNLGPIKHWGLQIEDDSIVVNTKMETNRPGIYAAGDIVTFPGKLKLIATGFGEAATAVNNAAAYINPRAKVFPGHSSTIMEQKEKKATPAGASAG
ncbi:MAG: NAD(P)/FAD-dependent oxidoreductase [Armatimonadota bacterium]|nr:NAD(P)/FAD-dependent oxidoreductase [Armatimonadota bacterium]MDR7591812.1 NAD(P)/FAD-dependent oxidoreductase [Armatimonadota bacterium]